MTRVRPYVDLTWALPPRNRGAAFSPSALPPPTGPDPWILHDAMKTSPTILASLTLFAFSAAPALALAAPAAGAPRAQEPAPQEKVPTMQEAQALLNAGDMKGAAEALGKISAAQPQNGQAVFLHAYALHGAGDLKAAHDRHLEAANFPQFRPVALYNHACVHSLWKETDIAIQSLQEAVDAGFGSGNQAAQQINYLETDTDLDHVRSDARFQALLAGLKPMPKLSSLAPERLFDFYRGEWELVQGDAVQQVLTVTPAFGGKGWRVSMTNPADGAEVATSVYTYDAAKSVWRQTWIDASGRTISMAGGLEGESIALRVESDSHDPKSVARAVLSDVTRDSFRYAWQTSADQGKTWESQGELLIRRKQ